MTPAESWEHELLSHEAFLRRLARRLVMDEARAEDLVQDAYVAALSKGPDDPSAVRAWLSTLMRRLAGRDRRADGRRRIREERSARPEAQARDDVDARLEAHVSLLALLRGLPVDERRALFLRYGEDLAPPAIAQRLGVAQETVRTRLRRGRERLRTELDAAHGGRRAWGNLLMPLPVLRECAVATSFTMPVTTTVATTMGFKLAAIASVSVLAILLGLSLTETGSHVSEDALRPAGESAELDVDELRAQPLAGRVAIAADGERPAPRDNAEEFEVIDVSEWVPDTSLDSGAPAGAPAWWVEIDLLGTVPLGTEVKVGVELDSFGGASVPPVWVPASADGTTRVDVGQAMADLEAKGQGQRAVRLSIELRHADLPPQGIEARLPEPLERQRLANDAFRVEIPVRAGALLTGHLDGSALDSPQGQPRAIVYKVKDGRPRGKAVAHVDIEDRELAMALDVEGPHLLVIVGNGIRPHCTMVELVRGSRLDLGGLVVDEGEVLTGEVNAESREGAVHLMLANGKPLVRLPWHWKMQTLGLVWVNGRAEYFSVSQSLPESGSFRIVGLAQLPYMVSTSPAEGQTPFSGTVAGTITPSTRLHLSEAFASVELQLQSPDESLADGTAKIRWTWGEKSGTTSHDIGARSEGWRINLPANQSVGLELTVEGFEPIQSIIDTPGPGGSSQHELTLGDPLPRGTVVLKLRGATPADGTRVSVRQKIAGRGVVKRKARIESGAVRLEDLAPGPATIDFVIGEDWFAPQDHLCLASVEVNVLADAVVTKSVDMIEGGGLVLEAVDSRGRRQSGRVQLWDASGSELDIVFVAGLPNGRVAGPGSLFDSAPSRLSGDLPAGTYTLRISVGGFQRADRSVEILAGRTAELRIKLVEK